MRWSREADVEILPAWPASDEPGSFAITASADDSLGLGGGGTVTVYPRPGAPVPR